MLAVIVKTLMVAAATALFLCAGCAPLAVKPPMKEKPVVIAGCRGTQYELGDFKRIVLKCDNGGTATIESGSK